MKFIKDALQKIKLAISPEPPEIDKFCYLPQLNHLYKRQIEQILDMINKEIEISAGFGLEIRSEDQHKEKLIILSILNGTGGVSGLKRNFDSFGWEDVRQAFSEVVHENLSEEIKYYFENTPLGEIKSKYNAHLLSVITGVLRAIDMNNIYPWVD